jgi:hypothetical protein
MFFWALSLRRQSKLKREISDKLTFSLRRMSGFEFFGVFFGFGF